MDNLKNMTRKDRIDYLKKNQESLKSIKMATVKQADGVSAEMTIDAKAGTAKQTPEELEEKDELEASLIINTTNILDSHGDVHIPGLWNKSINENRKIMLLREHKMEFEHIIADKEDLIASTKDYTWKQLGFNWEGKTEALLFNAIIKRERNSYMFNQYAKGRVDNHSVGMRYMKMALAIDDDDAGSNYEVWEKYIDQIVNRKDATDAGYFWVVNEAKVIEGSAVPLGSNFATPTQEIKSEPFWDTLAKSVKPLQAPDELNQFYKHLNI